MNLSEARKVVLDNYYRYKKEIHVIGVDSNSFAELRSGLLKWWGEEVEYSFICESVIVGKFYCMYYDEMVFSEKRAKMIYKLFLTS